MRPLPKWVLWILRLFIPELRGWRVHTEPDEHGMIHVWPVASPREHLTDGTDVCWCRPNLETVGAYCLVTHRLA